MRNYSKASGGDIQLRVLTPQVNGATPSLILGNNASRIGFIISGDRNNYFWVNNSQAVAGNVGIYFGQGASPLEVWGYKGGIPVGGEYWATGSAVFNLVIFEYSSIDSIEVG